MNLFERIPLSADEQAAANNDVQDWGESLSNMTISLCQLNESVPNGQIERTAHYFELLEANARHLRKFLEIRGALAKVEALDVRAAEEPTL
jgi:hypothetical protein